MRHAVEAAVGEFGEALRKTAIFLNEGTQLSSEDRIDCAIDILANVVVSICGDLWRWRRQRLSGLAVRRSVHRRAEVTRDLALVDGFGFFLVAAENYQSCQGQNCESHDDMRCALLKVGARVDGIHGEFPVNTGNMRIGPNHVTFLSMSAG